VFARVFLSNGFYFPFRTIQCDFLFGRMRTFAYINVIFPLVLSIFLLLIGSLLLFPNLMLIPTPIQRLFEIAVLFIFNLIKQQMGKVGYIYFPLIFTFFLFYIIY